ncbi:MAG: hypothetical protein JF888_03955 [Candidatus Dormibacteraeota bacterium]|uniref:DUF3618 domain-containing protein n=1 Tax=Candidatus Dormiibacter inghamiae TaxID=3127013 RepID=A0A934KCL8_9BACT|nr:hypothetical protein [Candidatus Dormibacteraeota bacterium]MBJ7604943.1 hypothetical protein [Candidatus Dormibacteraeota bacterium]
MTEESTSGAPQKAVQEKAQQAKEQALQVTSSAKEQLQVASGSAREKMREQVNTRSTQAGHQVDSIGQAMRKAGEHLSGQGYELPAKAADQLAQRVEQLGGYLRESDADRILGDLENYARQQPLIVATAGLAVGVAAARFLKTSSQRRYQQGKPSPEPGGSDELATEAGLSEPPTGGSVALPPTRT